MIPVNLAPGEPILSAKNLRKEFSYLSQMPSDLKGALISLFKKPVQSFQRDQIVVIEDLSFDVYPGEFVAIMGKNGAGKSTLLRLLSGVYAPSSGEIIARANITPLISLKAGFSPDLSGYENIFLNASILGFSEERARASLQSIVEFSELEEKIFVPIRQYSSGMVARLGFSIASHLDSPILLLDEILSVGDVGFKRKSLKKILELSRSGRTVVFVTHSPDMVRKFCQRCIVIADGHKIFDGSAVEGAARYEELFPGLKDD